jgi:hypothetical protein
MKPSLVSLTPSPAVPTADTPLSILRTETVLSRFPIHLLAKQGRSAIQIRRTTAQGDLDVCWEVSYNERYGPPRQLAYKLDTVVINQRLDALPRPLPRVLRLGSLRQIGTLLDVQGSGAQQAHLKRALHQNASAYIVARLRYRDRDGSARLLNTGFTRYSVIWTGERLPDGTTADAVYLSLSDAYLEVLNHAPVRPLDYTYLKALTPAAQRCYELVSYKIFAALKYGRPHATLRYADYCLLATQHRYLTYEQVKKQMYKVHRPHLVSGYLHTVGSTRTTDADGHPDWLLHYTPGPKAHAEYAAFMRQPGAEEATARLAPADADPENLALPLLREPPRALPHPPAVTRVAGATLPAPATQTSDAAPRASDASCAPAPVVETAHPVDDAVHTQALALVRTFYQRFHGRAQVTPSPKELAQATHVLTQHGVAQARYLLDFSHQAARHTAYCPQVFGGILHYLPQALAAYDARALQTTTQQAEATERAWYERYLTWQQQELARLRAAVPPADLAALEETTRVRLVAEGMRGYFLDFAVRVAVHDALATQAALPSFAAWRAAQTTPAGTDTAVHGVPAPAAGGADHAA